ncbi:unnamed protein product, partial [Mesorhabditis belari]|uniref:MADF domain-containing protein n=1 Tax=Mesorhabditis belari TaxID=2138241 RepID=A0AAF3EZ36_9BILA
MNGLNPKRTDEFITFMRQLPVLWIPESKIDNHNSKEVNLAKAEAWRFVSNHFSISVREAKDQWNLLLLVHRKIYERFPDTAFRYERPECWDPRWNSAIDHLAMLYANFFQEDMKFLFS